MKKIIILLLCSLTSLISAHSNHDGNSLLRHWKLGKENKVIDGSFYMFKNDEVYIEEHDHTIVHFPLSSFSLIDQAYTLEKLEFIKTVNNKILSYNTKLVKQNKVGDYILFSIFGFIILSSLIMLLFINKKKRTYILPVFSLGIVLAFFGFTKNAKEAVQITTTSIAFMDSAFAAFIPNVNTYTTPTYFYVESKGIPTTHTMMVGISSTGWQQQVPLPKCYIGSSAWPVPINPVIAATAVPVNASHFTKGAIAIAVNGVPIFNPYTNTGVDAFIDGQLDTYGGHCGRGDDYHYHTAPLHLYGTQAATLPIAFALDGFAVYGSKEPDGASMLTLDVNHGHYRNGVYHYHGSIAAPYMIANMVGTVTEDANKQIIPQPQGSPVRTENWGPLNGALITSCLPNGNNNGYNVSYSLNGNPGYATNYSWIGTVYTYTYVTPTGTTSINYTGPAQCAVPSAINENNLEATNLSIYPNPCSDILNLKILNSIKETDIKEIAIYSLNGDLVYKTIGFKENISIKQLSQGTYIVKVSATKSELIKRIVVQ
jgi:hypothetical protein